MTTPEVKAISFWRLNLAGWTAFAVAMTISRIGRLPVAYMLATKGAMGTLGLLYSGFLLRPLYRRLLRDDPPLARVIVVTGVASYAMAILWTGSHSIVDILIVRALLNASAHITSFWQVFSGTLYDAFAMLAWSVLYVGIKHQQAYHAERERALRAESLAHQARLDALRWQLNPHFLFNALNAISTLVVDGRSTEAAAMIARLGDLLRGTLELPAGPEVSFAAELELMRRYIDIEQVRFGERLSINVSVEEVTWTALVPPLMLQPVVENAIRHAVSLRAEGGRVSVNARRVADRLHVTVEDDGPGIETTSAATVNGNGIGLANVRERLRYLYGDAHRFTLDRGPLGGVRVRFDLPFRD